MIKKEVVSTRPIEVRSNGTIKTNKPSSVTMAIQHRFAVDASQFYLSAQENIEPETGLIGFELVAIYEDGKAEVKEIVDLEFEKIGETLDEVTNEEKPAMPFEDYSEKQNELEEVTENE